MPPACFSIGFDENTLTPHENSPNKHHTDCKTCEYNKFESAFIGKGKMCKNNRRLALYAYDDNGIAMDEMVILRIAPSSLKNFKTYLTSTLSKLKRPLYAVVTTLSFDENEQYPIVTFKLKHLLENMDDVIKIKDKESYINSSLLEPYDTSSYEPLDNKSQTNSASKKSKMS
jgi:hypothetical protein